MTRGRDAARGGGSARRGATSDVLDALELDVPARTDAVAMARHAVAQHLARAGVPSTVIDDIELVASELVTNAIIHPRPPATSVQIRVDLGDVIELMVGNAGVAAAIPPVAEWRPAPAAALSGRGLGIVRRLCDEVSLEQVGERAVITCWRSVPDRGVRR
jgi:anti-sigma regulatory factor (Ser/Thr protein kinase)